MASSFDCRGPRLIIQLLYSIVIVEGIPKNLGYAWADWRDVETENVNSEDADGKNVDDKNGDSKNVESVTPSEQHVFGGINFYFHRLFKAPGRIYRSLLPKRGVEPPVAPLSSEQHFLEPSKISTPPALSPTGPSIERLVRDIPEARVFTFGFDAYKLSSTTVDLAKKINGQIWNEVKYVIRVPRYSFLTIWIGPNCVRGP